MGLSEFLRKTFADQTSRAKEAGQAALEYILILVITVSLILGLMYQFNDAFKQFLDSYFGDYIACLLETGELPALGGSGPNQGECNTPNFSVDAGSASDSASGGGSSGSNGSSSDSSNGDSSSSSSSDSGSSGGSNRSRRDLRTGRVSSSGSTSNGETAGNSLRGSRPSSLRGKDSSQFVSNKEGFSADSTEGGAGGRRGRRIVRRRTIYLGDEYLDDAAKKKGKNAVVGKGKPKRSAVSDIELRKAKFQLQVPEGRKVASEIEMDTISLGAFIKFLIIGGILVAIFLFLGGQAMQIKKSWQKSE